MDEFYRNSILKFNLQLRTLFLKETNSIHFENNKSLPDLSTNNIHHQNKLHSKLISSDIFKHKALKRGQQFTKVHISYPQSPSIVHVNEN